MSNIRLFNVPDPIIVIPVMPWRFIARIVLLVILSSAVGIVVFTALQLNAQGSIGYDSIVKTITVNAIFSVFIAFIVFWFFYTSLRELFGIKK